MDKKIMLLFKIKLDKNIPDRTGIYILTRVDENGFKYCYVGQAKKILTRLGQHLLNYQHIDLSLKKHGLFDADKNLYGWCVDYFECLESELDGYEQEYILKFANVGYQMRNKTIGSQHEGKAGLNENKAPKGYHDGLKQGYQNCLKDIKEYFDKYLVYGTKTDPSCYKKPKHKGEVATLKEIYIKKFEEFEALLEEITND